MVATVSSYTVGQSVEVWSDRHSQWVPTKIQELKEVCGEKMLTTKYKPASCIPINSASVRPIRPIQQQSEATGAASQTGPSVSPAGPPVSLGPAAPTVRRERGTYSDEAKRVAASLLGVHGSVLGIFESWATTYAKEQERRELKDKILRVFSKEPKQGVCYLNLSTPGAEKGQAHPSMLNFVPAVFDLYTPYTIDFLRELEDVWTCGFKGTLKLTVYSPSGGDGCWSDFAYGPDGSYSDFVKYSVIAFLVIASSSDGLLSLTDDWLRDDLRGLQAVCYTGGQLERSLQSLKNSIKESKTARAPDPLMMLDNMLTQQNLSSQAKATDFIKKYNSAVFYDKALILENHTAARQCDGSFPNSSG